MRSVLALVGVLALTACGQPSEKAAPQSAPSAPSAQENVIAHTNWAVRDGTLVNGAFTIQPGSFAYVQNARSHVADGDSFSGQVVLAADGPASVTVRISNGCGTVANDQSFADYDVRAGENTLLIRHTFVRPANCARLSIQSKQPLTFRLSSSELIKQ